MDPRVTQLAEASVLGLENGAHKLGEHFATRPAALLFVRHFG